MRCAFLALILIFATIPAMARSPEAPASCQPAIDDAQARQGLPSGLLSAVALVESGRPDPRSGVIRPWPWTINVEGAGFFFPSKPRAIAAVQALLASGFRSIDVGCLQVNLMYHPAAFANLEQAFDPMANARYAARFLDALYDRSQNWTKAVADYHSQTPALGAAYRNRVLARWHPPDGTEIRYADFAPTEAAYGAFRSGGTAAYADFAPETAPTVAPRGKRR